MLDDGLMVRPPESKVTPLPTSARWATAPLGAHVSRARRERGVGGVADAEDAAAAHRGELLVVEDLELDLGGAAALGDLLVRGGDEVGEQRRRAVPGGRVDPVAAQHDGVGEDLGALLGGDRLGAACDGAEHHDVGRLGGLGLLRLVGGEGVAAEAVALDDRLDQLGGLGREGEGDRGGVGDAAGGDAGGTSYGDRVRRVVAEADEDQQRCVDLVARRRLDRLARLARHAHRGEEGPQPPAVGLGDVGSRLAELWSLVAGDDAHDDGVGSGLGGAGGAERVRGHPRMLGES